MGIADRSGTSCGDTSGIRALVLAHKRAKASHTGFRVVAGPGEIRRVLEILSLDTVLDLYHRLDLALVASDREPAEMTGIGGAASRARPALAGCT